MRVHARLNVADDHVLCPRTGNFESLEHCSRCKELTCILDDEVKGPVVVCEPELDRLESAVAQLAG